MSSKTLRDEGSKRLPKSVMFSQRCLGIVLKRVLDKARPSDDELSAADSTEAVDPNAEDWMLESGYLIFQDFQEENRHCFWNPSLVDSLNNVEYMGFVIPGTLLVGGNEYYLEAVRSAWARRVLKPPANYIITRLGDVTGFDIQVIPQIQFTPLPEALCLVVSDLNSQGETASLSMICGQLHDRFSDMIVPNEDLIYSSLGKLIKDRKIYHTGNGYFIVTPETYRLTTVSALPERPILMTNEEALQKLHGNELCATASRSSGTLRSRSIQANMDEVSKGKSSEKSTDRTTTPTRLERFGSMRLSRKEKSHSEDEEAFLRRRDFLHLSPERSKSLVKDINLKTSPAHQDVDKGEKISVFHKLFRRSSSKRRKGSKSPAKYATFAAQFPPVEWGDPNNIHFQSRATQTLEHRTPKDKLASTHSLRSKTDSLGRLRDHEKHHHRSHTTAVDSPYRERQSRLDEPVPTSSRSSYKSSSIPRRSFPSTSTPESPSPSKKIGSSSTLSRAERRYRRAESCTLVPLGKERNTKINGSPEKCLIAAKEKSDDVKLNNAEIKSDVPNEAFSSTHANNTLPKTKVAPYRIVSAMSDSKKDLKMNNSSEKSNSSTKWENSETVKHINKLNSPTDEKVKKVQEEPESISKTFRRLSTSSSINCDFDVTFTSLAAQKILTGASINSIDTLVEVNMAAEKLTGLPTGTNDKSKDTTKELSPLNNSPTSPTYRNGPLLSYATKIKNDSSGLIGNQCELKQVNKDDSLKSMKAADMKETRVLGIV